MFLNIEGTKKWRGRLMVDLFTPSRNKLIQKMEITVESKSRAFEK